LLFCLEEHENRMKSFIKIILCSLILISSQLGELYGSQKGIRESGERGGVHLNRLQTIQIPPNPNEAEIKVSRLLHQKLRDHYGIHLKILKQTFPEKTNTILVGPQLAVASRMVTRNVLSNIGWDGYVLRAENDTVVMAGPEPQGTLYAAYAFLKKIGISFYPWHFGQDIEVLEPLEGNTLKPFVTHRKPFFELRDLFPQFENGQFGCSIRRYSLGDLGFANMDPKFKKMDTSAGIIPPVI